MGREEADPAEAGLSPADETELLGRLRLHQLEGFYHVCRHQGFARAVQALAHPITESALHQQVRKLERALGTRLLIRGSGRRMLPTPEGRALFDFVADYFVRLPGVLRQVAHGSAARFVVAAEPLYVEGFCAVAAQRLRAAEMDVTLRLQEADAADIVTALEEGRIDLGIASELPVAPAALVFEALGHLGLSLLVPAVHTLARARPPLRPASFQEHAFILYEPGTEGRSYTDGALRQLELRLAVAAEASSAHAMRALVRAGVGPAFVPSLRGGEAGRRSRPRRRRLADGVVEFDLTELVGEVIELPRYGVLWRRDLRWHPLPRRFVEELARLP